MPDIDLLFHHHLVVAVHSPAVTPGYTILDSEQMGNSAVLDSPLGWSERQEVSLAVTEG